VVLVGDVAFEGNAFGAGTNPGSSSGSSLPVDIEEEDLIPGFEEAFSNRRSEKPSVTFTRSAASS